MPEKRKHATADEVVVVVAAVIPVDVIDHAGKSLSISVLVDLT